MRRAAVVQKLIKSQRSRRGVQRASPVLAAPPAPGPPQPRAAVQGGGFSLFSSGVVAVCCVRSLLFVDPRTYPLRARARALLQQDFAYLCLSCCPSPLSRCARPDTPIFHQYLGTCFILCVIRAKGLPPLLALRIAAFRNEFSLMGDARSRELGVS